MFNKSKYTHIFLCLCEEELLALSLSTICCMDVRASEQECKNSYTNVCCAYYKAELRRTDGQYVGLAGAVVAFIEVLIFYSVP